MCHGRLPNMHPLVHLTRQHFVDNNERRPAAQGSLLQSLLQPLRPREPSQSINADAGLAEPASPLGSLASSPRQLSTMQFDAPPAVVLAGSIGAQQQQQQEQQHQQHQQQQQQQQQQQPVPWSRLAQLQAAGTGLLQATGTSNWIRNPAAALTSLTSRIGNHLQPGYVYSRPAPVVCAQWRFLTESSNNGLLTQRTLSTSHASHPGSRPSPSASVQLQLPRSTLPWPALRLSLLLPAHTLRCGRGWAWTSAR